MKENYQIYLPYQFHWRVHSALWDPQLSNKKRKTMFLWNMSKSRRLTSTFFPTTCRTTGGKLLPVMAAIALQLSQIELKFEKKKLETKDQAKWAEWARKLKNTLTDLHAQTCFKTFISPTFNRHSFHQHSFHQLKIKKKIEVNELSELDYSKAPSTMSSYTQEHVFLYLHAQTNINTLFYWSYTKSEKNQKKFYLNFL